MSKTETSRRSPYVALGVLIGAAVLAVLAVRSCARDAVGVRVASASYADLVSAESTNGKVEPVGEFQAHAPTAGVVARLYVDAGDKVKAGDLLVQMRDPDATARVATATSALRTAELNLQDLERNGTTDERISMEGDLTRAKQQQRDAQSSLTALQQLQQKGAASTSEVSGPSSGSPRRTIPCSCCSTAAPAGMAPAMWRARRHSWPMPRRVWRRAESGYASANIKSPISGTVYSVPVSEYDFVQAGEDLLDVADLNQIQITAYFDEPEIGKLAAGQSVKIVWDAKPTGYGTGM